MTVTTEHAKMLKRGPFAERPAASVGRYWYLSDEGGLYKSDGSAWTEVIAPGGGGGAVSSVFTRTGAVVAASGDYTAGQVTNVPAGGIAAVTVQAALNELDTEKVTANGAITGATKTKVTYDAKGLVTAGADATTADIADSTNKRYVTDANLTVIGNTSGTNTGDQTTVSGNAGTATALQTARTINGTSFDGTANITAIPPLVRSARSSNTILAAADKGTVICATAAYTQTLTAAATLGAGWWVIVKNDTADGTTVLTLDPAGAETIDALTTITMYSGETRLIECDGSNFFSQLLEGGYAKFTPTGGNFIVPAGIKAVEVVCIGGGGQGGGGGSSVSTARSGGTGGGGGAVTRARIPAAAVTAAGTTITVTVGAGGSAQGGGGAAGVGANGTNGSDGAATSFGGYLKAGGGGGGVGGNTVNIGSGGGGSVVSSGVGTTAGAPSAAAAIGGQGAASPAAAAAGNNAEWGGGSGGGSGAPSSSGAGGSSIFGGPAGGGGGAVSVGNVGANGSAGGGNQRYTAGGGGTLGTGGASPSAGGVGTGSQPQPYCGAGGGGGGGGSAVAGKDGGVGGIGAGGGGGSSSSTTSSAAGGNGGAGGAGQCQVFYS